MKTQKIEPVQQDWVLSLPFTQQALLFLALRGPDGVSKNSTAKTILHFLRGAVLKPAYAEFDMPGSVDFHNDGFMRTDYGEFETAMNSFFLDVDEYPHHFLMHLFHAAEVIAFANNSEFAWAWNIFYKEATRSLHMNPESSAQLSKRLSK